MRHAVVVLLVSSALVPAASAAYSDVYFFGDSLTDTGNVSTVYASLPHPPGAPAVIPGPPYDPSGRTSNGLLYADWLAAGLGHDAEASLRGGNNYAYAGARTRYQLGGAGYLGIVDQVAEYRALPGAADADALYVLWGGSNNLQDILLGRTTDVFGNPIPNVAQTLGDIGGLIDGLYAEGVRNLLVPNVPNLGRVPRVRDLGGAPAQALARQLSEGYNAGLSMLLNNMEALHPDLNIIRFDTFAALENLIAGAPGNGFTNTTDRCYTGDDLGFTGGGTLCSNPENYIFWDGIHPTARAHQILGGQMLAAVVPEPQSALLLLVGGLMVGGFVRLRRAAHSSL